MGGWNIPLAVQPAPQNPGPLDLYKEGLSVQTLVNQQALQKQAQQQNQQALASNQIKLQQEQQEQQDQQALRSLAPKYANKDGDGTFDFEGLANEALTKTGNLNLVNSLRSQRYQMIEQASKAGSEQLANEQAHNKAAYEVIEGVKGVTDPAQRQTAYAQGMNKLKLLGVDTTKLPANAPNDDALESYESGLGMHGQLLADAKTHAETNEKNAEAAEKEWQKFPEMGTMINTRTGEQRTIQGGLVPPGQQEAKYLNIQTKKNQGQPLTPEEAAFSKSYEHFKELVPQFTNTMAITGGGLGPTGGGGPTPPALAGGPAAMQGQPTPEQIAAKAKTAPGGWVSPNSGKTLNDVPAAIRGEVQQVMEYRRDDPTFSARGPVAQAVNSWVADLDPHHNEGVTFKERNKVLNDYIKDASTGEIGAVNTSLGHLHDLSIAAKAVSDNNLPILHSLAAHYGLATGDDAASTYQSILHRVGPELTKAYLKSGGTEGERGSTEGDLDISKGAKQINSNIAEAVQNLNSKIESKRNNWENSFQPYRDQDHFDNRFLTKDAKAAIQELAPQAPTNRAGATASAAGVPANVSKALANVGSGRHKLSDGSTWDKHPDGTIVKSQ